MANRIRPSLSLQLRHHLSNTSMRNPRQTASSEGREPPTRIRKERSSKNGQPETVFKTPTQDMSTSFIVCDFPY
ncbi:Protein CBG24435 [Caenorhabditis briggsae]|uniref:Protein CBG24435 n=1 Tax=Caenorhabditis briggsae TaxID=6238 RepID=A8WKQ1_CAEBR|nr:Protein CBG24435 [Caenorhabditis briggsae]CAP21046.1 Protein CBG24435 [Caenorhabditis briggsae]